MEDAMRVLFLACISMFFLLFPSESFGQSAFRQKYWDVHYYDNQCCYCGKASSIQPLNDGTTVYTVDGVEYIIPDKYERPSDPTNPNEGIMVCDPVEEDYLCVIGAVSS